MPNKTNLSLHNFSNQISIKVSTEQVGIVSTGSEVARINDEASGAGGISGSRSNFAAASNPQSMYDPIRERISDNLEGEGEETVVNKNVAGV